MYSIYVIVVRKISIIIIGITLWTTILYSLIHMIIDEFTLKKVHHNI